MGFERAAVSTGGEGNKGKIIEIGQVFRTEDCRATEGAAWTPGKNWRGRKKPKGAAWRVPRRRRR